MKKKYFFMAAGVVCTGLAVGSAFYFANKKPDEQSDILPTIPHLDELDVLISRLAKQNSILSEQLIIEMTQVDEQQLFDFLKTKLIEINAVLSAGDITFDLHGNFVWTIKDPEDTTPLAQRKIIYVDGCNDSPSSDIKWENRISGLDPRIGITNISMVDFDQIAANLPHLPPKKEWSHLIFGRGVTSKFQGIACQMIASQILLQTRDLGSLKGTVVRFIIPAAHSPRIDPDLTPDVVILAEPTGSFHHGPCGINIGQHGRVPITVSIKGPGGIAGKKVPNPTQYGCQIITQAALQSEFGDNDFIGRGSRRAVRCNSRVSGLCTIPSQFDIEFDRLLTIGENPAIVQLEITELPAFQAASEHFDTGVDVSFVKLPWTTPSNHPVVKSAIESYARTITPTADNMNKKPFLDHWRSSTDGGCYLVDGMNKKGWVECDGRFHPPMFGIGAGYEEHCHKIGEFLDKQHLWAPIAVISRFPSVYLKSSK